MSNFLHQLFAGNPIAITISFLAVFVPACVFLAIRTGTRKHRAKQQINRRNGYSHTLKRVEPPAPLRAVPIWPPPIHRDVWAPSVHERNGRAGPAVGYQDQVAKNAERHRRSLP